MPSCERPERVGLGYAHESRQVLALRARGGLRVGVWRDWGAGHRRLLRKRLEGVQGHRQTDQRRGRHHGRHGCEVMERYSRTSRFE